VRLNGLFHARGGRVCLLEQGETPTLHLFLLQLTWTGFAHQEGFEEGEFWKVNEGTSFTLGVRGWEKGLHFGLILQSLFKG
jgi:hypothetical protein